MHTAIFGSNSTKTRQKLGQTRNDPKSEKLKTTLQKSGRNWEGIVNLGEKAKLRLGGETERNSARETRAAWKREVCRGSGDCIDGSSRRRE